MSEAEIAEVVQKTIGDINAVSMKDMGKVMGKLKGMLEGRADMAVVSQVVKGKLTNI